MNEEEQKHERGRPWIGKSATIRPIAFRPTEAQRKWIEKQATRKGLTVSEYVRACLHTKGMPI